MINHARTLLLNKSGAFFSGKSILGYEYVPLEFAAVNLPGYLDTVHRSFFGKSPDEIFMNYRVIQLLRTVESTDYSDYLIYPDSRITYKTTGRTDFLTYQFSANTTNLDGEIEVEPVGGFTANESLGRARAVWKLEFIGEGRIRITNLINNKTETKDYAKYGDRTEVIMLTDTFGVKLVSPDESGAVIVKAFARPYRSIVEITNDLTSIAAEFVNSLFGRTPSEPYATFYGLWKSKITMEKLTGVILAFIYRIHKLKYGVEIEVP